MNKIDYIGVSALTASIIELKKIRTDANSNQAYLMMGTNCNNSCSFCAQSRLTNKESNLLSRVSWPEYPTQIVIDKLNSNDQIKKICFQVVSTNNYFENFLRIFEEFKSKLRIPIGASINVYNIEQVDYLFNLGLANLGIAIDAASDEIYKKIKKRKNGFNENLNLAIEASKKYPSKIAIHLIIGLGETDTDILNLFQKIAKEDLTIALFSFTPIKGTEMENYPVVPLKRYRFIQFIRQILVESKYKIEFNDLLKFINIDDNNMISSFDKRIFEIDFIKNIIQKGEYLKTSGCNLCNRPFYNDKPDSKDLYNFHYNPPKDIILKWENFLMNSK